VLTLQQMLDIACRHATRMAEAMVAACQGRALETGERLRMPERRAPRAGTRGQRPEPDTDWERLVSGNSDTRWMHQ